MNLYQKQQQEFLGRHIGPNEHEISEMLTTIGVASVSELIENSTSFYPITTRARR